MKHTLLVSVLWALGSVFSSQAVVIGWASEALPAGTTSAILVYVVDGTPTYAGGAITHGVELGPAATGGAIMVPTLWPQETTDSTERTSGMYYVVLFNDAQQYAVSDTSLAWNNGPSISTHAQDPITQYFSPVAFGSWTAVPEPSTAMLLVAGAAVAALRRRKQA